MIKQSILFEREQSIAVLQAVPEIPRGKPERRIGAGDLIDFGRSPYRWVWGEDPEDPLAANGPSVTEWMTFDIANLERYFIRRPDTYEAMKLECPKCHSAGPAKVCTKCGQRRRNIVVPRAWNSAVKVCQAWLEKAAAMKKQPVPGPEWDRAQMGVEAILAYKAIAQAIKGCTHLRTMHGTWLDEATGLEIPVWARATLVPTGQFAGSPALVQFVECRNADPSYWEGGAYSAGLHISAALRMALWNALDLVDVREHLWIVIERDPPRLVARRRAAPELLAEGRTRLTELMHTYAACLNTGVWPRFEPEDATGLDAWSMVSLQPWLTSGTGPHGGYFAPTAVPVAAREQPRYAQAA